MAQSPWLYGSAGLVLTGALIIATAAPKPKPATPPHIVEHVSPEEVAQGLRALKAAGEQPGFVLVEEMARTGPSLTADIERLPEGALKRKLSESLAAYRDAAEYLAYCQPRMNLTDDIGFPPELQKRYSQYGLMFPGGRSSSSRVVHILNVAGTHLAEAEAHARENP